MQSSFIHPLLGGIIIGISVSLMLFFNGRVTGISGIVYGLLQRPAKENVWRFYFVGGLLLGGFTLRIFRPDSFSNLALTPDYTLPIAGFLVGFGTVLGGGCTSGHGVCGISRLSLRSIVATVVFIAAGIASVFAFRQIGVLP